MDFDPDAPASSEDGLFGLGADPETAAVVVLAVPWQATTSYRRGTRDAPAKVVEASLQVDLFDRVTGDAWRQGLALGPDLGVLELDGLAQADALAVIAAGGVHEASLQAAAGRVDALSEEVNGRVERACRALLERGAIPAVLGGDHSCPLGLLRAYEEPFDVLHIDAHADLRPAYEGFTFSHASIFHNALELPTLGRLVQLGIRDLGEVEAARIRTDRRIHTFFDADVAWADRPWKRTCEEAVGLLGRRVHVSIDVDGLDPALCPTTGTPVPGGLDWPQITTLLRVLADSGRRIVGFDICETGPGDWDAIVSARLLYRLGCHAAALRRPG